MNKRLVWNFEIAAQSTLSDQPQIDSTECLNNRWEIRYFWPDEQIILLSGLNASFLDLSHYRFKQTKDIYYLLPNSTKNIKKRQDKITYKAFLQKKDHAIAYKKKIIVHHDTPLNAEIKAHAIAIKVEKERFTYRFKTTPKLKMELAKLTINHKTFFSLSIESKALSLVENLSKQLRCNQQSCDYVTFLKTRIPSC